MTMQAYERLEYEWADFHSVHPSTMVACSSGTAALHLAFEVLGYEGMQQGSQVVVPDWAMYSCPRAVSMAGFVPRFVDVSRSGALLPLNVLKHMTGSEFSPSVGAVLYVSNYGNLGGINAIMQDGKQFGIPVIEDLAECSGAAISKDAYASCWSFYRNKIIHGEEGGMVRFQTKEQADVARMLRCIGFTSAHDYTHIPRGHNYRLANLLAAPILESLTEYRRDNGRKQWDRYEYWNRELGAYRLMRPMSAPWVFPLKARLLKKWNENVQRSVVQFFTNRGIAARYGFKSLSMQEEYAYGNRAWQLKYNQARFPNSMELSSTVITLPLDDSITKETARIVAKEFKQSSLFPLFRGDD